MKQFLRITLMVLMLTLIGTIAWAQDKSQAYYNTHETEILPDAQKAFQSGNYERAVELCKWHYVMVGDSRANALREKAAKCAKLSVEMAALKADRNMEEALIKAQQLLALNPDDADAKAIVNISSHSENGYEWVDLGLSVKWATCNVGASSPEEFGSYFAWGETSPKSDYSWSTYKWCDGTYDSLTKYNTKSSYGIVDNKTCLDMSDDAARAIWGGRWRMPTDSEWEELCTKCDWTSASQGGKSGYKVTGRTNGNSIFLPDTVRSGITNLGDGGRHGNYWSSSLASFFPNCSLGVYLGYRAPDVSVDDRCCGHSIRPVTE